MAVNYIAIIVASIASFAIGFLWHGPLFGKMWMKEMGFTPKSMKKMKLSAGAAMFWGFIATLVTAYVLAYFVDYMATTTFALGAQLAFWLWLGLVAPVQFGKFLWEGKSFKLFVLNAAYYLVSLIVMTGILAIWP